MKITVDNENWKITLDNEAVKAIRFCYGLNTDLRVSLNTIPKEPLESWLVENRLNIFGITLLDFEWSTENTEKYEAMFADVVRQILR